MKNTKIFIFNYHFVGSLAHKTYFIIILIQLYLLSIYYVPGKVKITGKRPCLLDCAICSFLIVFYRFLFSHSNHIALTLTLPAWVVILISTLYIYFFHLPQIVNIFVYIVLKICIVFMWMCLFLTYQMVFL